MFHKVKDLFPLPGMRLSVLFADGTTKVYDVGTLIARLPVFEALRDNDLFSGVEVDVGGYGAIWNDDL